MEIDTKEISRIAADVAGNYSIYERQFKQAERSLRAIYGGQGSGQATETTEAGTEIKRLNNELSNSHTAIKRLKSKVKFSNIDREQLIAVMDSTRKKNGKANLTAMGRAFGRDKHTIKRLIIECNLLSYSKLDD
jgi:hypothetical protein